MPTRNPIAAARREAKSRARKGGITHQQALDEVARESGHAHWAAMTTSLSAGTNPDDAVRPFVLSYRHKGAAVDDEIRALLEDALHGYLAERPIGIDAYVEEYEFRGDGFDHVPDDGQKTIMRDALRRFADDHPPTPRQTLADVERDTVDLMRRASGRPGLGISDWVSRIMGDAAHEADSGRKTVEPRRRLRGIPMDAETMAQAIDPDGAPFAKRRDAIRARCPVHEDRRASLVVAGEGVATSVRCMAGCDPAALNDAAIAGLAAASARAAAFMDANDASRVVSGYGRGRPGVGGAGGVYELEDGSRHEMDVLACRLLAQGYPRWFEGDDAFAIKQLEFRVRERAGPGKKVVLTPPTDADGEWVLDCTVGDAADRYGGYRAVVRWSLGQPFGLAADTESDAEGYRVAGHSQEFHETPEAIEARLLRCLKEWHTTDPTRIAENEAAMERERRYMESIRGTDSDGWGWYVGPDEEAFTWGGPYRTRIAAINEGNGHCQEHGEIYFVVQARTDPDEEPDDEGMTRFAESRKPEAVKAR